MLDSVIITNKKYYTETLLEECKYKIKKNKLKNLINDDFDSSSSDNEFDNESVEESDNESDDESVDESDNESDNYKSVDESNDKPRE